MLTMSEIEMDNTKIDNLLAVVEMEEQHAAATANSAAGWDNSIKRAKRVIKLNVFFLLTYVAISFLPFILGVTPLILLMVVIPTVLSVWSIKISLKKIKYVKESVALSDSWADDFTSEVMDSLPDEVKAQLDIARALHKMENSTSSKLPLDGTQK